MVSTSVKVIWKSIWVVSEKYESAGRLISSIPLNEKIFVAIYR